MVSSKYGLLHARHFAAGKLLGNSNNRRNFGPTLALIPSKLGTNVWLTHDGP